MSSRYQHITVQHSNPRMPPLDQQTSDLEPLLPQQSPPAPPLPFSSASIPEARDPAVSRVPSSATTTMNPVPTDKPIKVEGFSDLVSTINNAKPILIFAGMFAFMTLVNFVSASTKARKTAEEVPGLLREILGELKSLREAVEAQRQA